MMPDLDVPTQLLCRQCAAPLTVEQGAAIATCEYCGTVNYLDKSEAVLHYTVRPTLGDEQATAVLRRWMAGNETAKGLDKAAQITSQRYELFPMWLARSGRGGDERVHLTPAAAVSVIELQELTIPASDLEPYDSSLDPAAVKPTVPLTALKRWLAGTKGVSAGDIREISLVHVPLYEIKYSFEGESYTALVDAASGRVFAAIFPEKYETPYVSIGGIGCLAYFLAALIPSISFVVGGVGGLGFGVLLYIGVAVVLAIPIFLVAARISQRY